LELGCCVGGGGHSFHYSLHNVIVPKPKVTFARAPCCYFTFHTGCIITVCNLLLAVPDGSAEPPSRRRGRRYKLLVHGSLEGGKGPGHVASVVNFSRPTLAGGNEKLIHQGPTRCRRPWSLTDGSCQCVHTDVTSQYRIVAIFTVVDSQALYQRKLLVFRCVSVITSVTNFTNIVSVVNYIHQSKR